MQIPLRSICTGYLRRLDAQRKMKITIPNLPQTVHELLSLESSFDGRTQTIGHWVEEHRHEIRRNLGLTNSRSYANDINVLAIFVRDLLVRNIVGEGGQRVYDAFREIIKGKDDLTDRNFRRVLQKAKYRWGVEVGCEVMSAVVGYFRDKLKWDWKYYLDLAERWRDQNFRDDELLKIKHVKFKVRDLALSNFNPNYAAFDLHVTRVVARIGLLAHGWDVTDDKSVEFGTNPSDNYNYLFLHRLFLRMSDLCDGQFSPVDLDRIFWHLGRSKCGARTECGTCLIQKTCLTGRKRASNKSIQRTADSRR